MPNKPVQKAIKKRSRGRGKPFVKGDPRAGRPKGQRSYSTILKQAITKIAKTRNMTLEEIEEELAKVGFDKALKGDYKFYQDVMDRTHGKAVQPMVTKTQVEHIISDKAKSKVDDILNGL